VSTAAEPHPSARLDRAHARRQQPPVPRLDIQLPLTTSPTHLLHTPRLPGVLRQALEPARCCVVRWNPPHQNRSRWGQIRLAHSHKVIDWLTRRRLAYSVGFTLPENTPDLLRRIPEHVWTPAYDAVDAVRDGASVAELTHLMSLSGWPPGMRVIVRKELPHPGAQLRFEDVDGMRITAFATNSRTGQLPDLELSHRRRAGCEDRIRIAKDAGLANLPLASFNANRIWCAVVALAAEIPAWMLMLAFTEHQARRWEPKKLRYRIFTIGATLARTGRRVWRHLSGPITLVRPDPDRAGTTRRPRPRRRAAFPSPTPPLDPRPWNRRPPRRHRAALSHPDSRIGPRRQQNCPTPPASRHRA